MGSIAKIFVREQLNNLKLVLEISLDSITSTESNIVSTLYNARPIIGKTFFDQALQI